MSRAMKPHVSRTLLGIACLALSSGAAAQGEDSRTWERDMQVIAEMLVGGFDNTNQVYFDFRAQRDTKHGRMHFDIRRVEAPELGDYVLVATGYRNGDETDDAGDFLWVLSPDDETQSVRMQSWRVETGVQADDLFNPALLAERESCLLYWFREAGQFRAEDDGSCGIDTPLELVLSEQQLWISFDGEGLDYKMHRVRNFECYADIPGVGGGRDIPYDRYDGLRLHDQGGQVWFTSKEGRRLGINLLLVDWPLNNYEGVFTRDSLVIYLSEEVDGERQELGYAFTVPEADRIGINLKWMLAMCFMKSNKFATPSM